MPVAQSDYTVAARSKFIEWVTMINAPLFAQAKQHVDDGGPVGSSGFQWVVGQKQFLAGDGRAGKGHALLFAA
jgi:hypothetical protein